MKENLLHGKNIAVFASYGAIGKVVAETLANKGAHVFISGRNQEKLSLLEQKIKSTGGKVTSKIVDATNEDEVAYFLGYIKKEGKELSGVFNAIGTMMKGKDHVKPALKITVDLFRKYFDNMVISQFITSREAAKIMSAQKYGSIVLMSATPSQGVAPLIPGPSTAHAAVDGLGRCLATEWGPMGIRVNSIMSGGMTETPNIKQVHAGMAREMNVPLDVMIENTSMQSALRRGPSVQETAEVVSFLLSDNASSITGAIINSSCGAIID